LLIQDFLIPVVTKWTVLALLRKGLTMELKIEIPIADTNVTFFISNIPAWLIGVIVIGTATVVTVLKALFN